MPRVKTLRPGGGKLDRLVRVNEPPMPSSPQNRPLFVVSLEKGEHCEKAFAESPGFSEPGHAFQWGVPQVDVEIPIKPSHAILAMLQDLLSQVLFPVNFFIELLLFHGQK